MLIDKGTPLVLKRFTRKEKSCMDRKLKLKSNNCIGSRGTNFLFGGN